jgi:hypothetical protein
VHDCEPHGALDGGLRAPLEARLDLDAAPALDQVPDLDQAPALDRSPFDGPFDAEAFTRQAYGPDGQVTRGVQAVGVDTVLAGFIAWLSRQPPERLDGPATTAALAATRRRCHRAVERFLRWHHPHASGLPCGGDGGLAAYDAALRQSGAGDAELTHTRRALALLAEYAQTGHPHWRWTP